jgi:UDP-N-acetylglucosamine 1-carboxyvinyltransferase
MSGIIRVTGGNKLIGEVTPIPNKNSIVAALPAALLSSEDVIFKNVPATSDVEKILQLMKMLGASIEESVGTVKINCKNLTTYKVDMAIGGQFRGSLMFVGPLLARFGKAEVPMPGGCELGMRSIEAHVDVFRAVGVKVERIGDYVRFEVPKKKENNYRVWQIEASVTATENFAMYAAGTNASFELIDAACEPHVVDVLNLLTDMGAGIEGAGSNRIKISGVGKFKKAEFTPQPDFIDICGLIVAAAVTDGKITLKGANIPDIVDGLIKWFVMFNIDIKRAGNDLVVSVGKGGLEVDVNKEGFPLAAPNLPKLYPRPWPGFPVDAIPMMATLASKSKGRLLLKNWMYESGLDFVRELNQMGADIMMMDPEKIIINGPVKFKGGTVTTPSVIQACKAIFLAALSDKVTTTIYGVDILRRRYPNIFEVYSRLGAKIELLSENVTGTKV